jgi:HEPN domain-containing protein
MDAEAAHRLNAQIWELWVEPEILRRSSQGALAPDFRVHAFQILLASANDGRANTVRLNEEVKAVAKIRSSQAIRAGEPVYTHDVEAIEEITLLETEANHAHITGIDLRGTWVVRLDLRYDKKRAEEHLEAANDFLETAIDAGQKGRWRPFLENLFVAAELTAKAELMITPTSSPKELKDHSKIKGKYMSWARLDNAPKSSSRALAELIKLRAPARYLKGPLSFDPERAAALVAAVREALEWTEQRVM